MVPVSQFVDQNCLCFEDQEDAKERDRADVCMQALSVQENKRGCHVSILGRRHVVKVVIRNGRCE